MDYPIPVDMDLICRVCMQIDEEMFWIFEELESEAERKESVAEMISKCTKYKVDRYDQLPHLICANCVEQVRQAYRFKTECEQNCRIMMELKGCTENIKKETVQQTGNTNGIEIAIQTDDGALYPCDRCEEKFYTFDSLRAHRGFIHKVTAIICRFCARSFNKQETLNKHIQTCHSNIVSEIVLESKAYNEKPSSSSTAEGEEYVQELEEEESEFITNAEAQKSAQEENGVSTSDMYVVEEYSEVYSEDGTEVTEEQTNAASESFMEVLIDDTEEKLVSGDEDHLEREYREEEDEDQGASTSEYSDDEGNKAKKRKSNTNTDEKRKRGRPRKDKPNQEFPHKCDLCEKSFEHEVNLHRHRYHHNEVKQQRTCETCGKYFSNEQLLQSHIKKAHNEPSIIYCDECPETFKLVKKFQRHKEKEHGAKFHNCTYCQKSFRSKMYLLRHMEKHSMKQYICRECSQGYATKEELNEHIKTERHDKTMLCPECGLRCKTSHELTAHRRSHNGEKPFKCKFCSKAFARMDALGMHEKYHIDVKSHFCVTCGKGFHRAYNLRVHERVHTGEKPYQCPHCPQAFKQGNDLKAHIRRHTGERFRCDICNAGFLQCYQMRQHKLSEHGIKEEAPTQRVAKFLSPEEQLEQINKSEVKREANETEEQQASEMLISIVWDPEIYNLAICTAALIINF